MNPQRHHKVSLQERMMRALVIDPYRRSISEVDVTAKLEDLQQIVRGDIEYGLRLDRGDTLYVNECGLGRYDARFRVGGLTATGYGVVVGGGGSDICAARTPLRKMRSLVSFPKPATKELPHFTIGQPTGLHPIPPADANAKVLVGAYIAPDGIFLVREISPLRAPDLAAITEGPVEVAINRTGSAVILTWRFADVAEPGQAMFDTWFHVGVAPRGYRFLPARLGGSGAGRCVPFLLQNAGGNCLAIRTLVIPPNVCNEIEAAVIEQALEAAEQPGFGLRYMASLQQYYGNSA